MVAHNAAKAQDKHQCKGIHGDASKALGAFG
jgi:hypothetical protein